MAANATIELIPSLEEMTPSDRTAYRERIYASDASAWDALDLAVSANDAIRARVKAGDSAFTRDDVVTALNYGEAVRIMTSVITSLASANLDRARENLRSARCSYCEWTYTDEAWDWPEGREIAADDIKAVDDRIKVEIRAHVDVCPKHPMRKLEAILEENFGDAERWKAVLAHGHVISQGNYHLTIGVRSDAKPVSDDSQEIRAFIDDVRAKQLIDSRNAGSASQHQ